MKKVCLQKAALEPCFKAFSKDPPGIQRTYIQPPSATLQYEESVKGLAMPLWNMEIWQEI